MLWFKIVLTAAMSISILAKLILMSSGKGSNTDWMDVIVYAFLITGTWIWL